jgi:hypothetical protein
LVLLLCFRLIIDSKLILFLLFKACAMSGLIADSKTLIDKARVETQVILLITKKKHTRLFEY